MEEEKEVTVCAAPPPPVAGFPTFFWAPLLSELDPSASLWGKYGDDSQGIGEGAEMMRSPGTDESAATRV